MFQIRQTKSLKYMCQVKNEQVKNVQVQKLYKFFLSFLKLKIINCFCNLTKLNQIILITMMKIYVLTETCHQRSMKNDWYNGLVNWNLGYVYCCRLDPKPKPKGERFMRKVKCHIDNVTLKVLD